MKEWKILVSSFWGRHKRAGDNVIKSEEEVLD